MKKLTFLVILAGTASLAHADYQNGYQGTCSGQGCYGPVHYAQGQAHYVSYQGQGYQQQSNRYQYQGDENQSNYQNHFKRSSHDLNQRLSAQIQAMLQSDRKYSSVDVEVSSGSVVIKGSVPTQKDRNQLEQKIGKIKGVKNINNQLNVGKYGDTSHSNY